ncbi:Uncharacterized protein dnl_29070 [Desulfonema limicola]|uniref:Uncharacterized protein n=1 Tax=Desulfonema limicola TaxID=45656 RepID=A0A975B852_9BACT|nr:hypothetical protein [Desulfonema limicola]QTA80598.1 Uncharacterized protein dnl_29070 [Desulfonema limicola]
MANIVIRDLEMNKELDKKAMSGIVGGVDLVNTQIICDTKISSVGIGTFVKPDTGEVIHRYKDCYYRLIKGETKVYDRSFISTTVPLGKC